MDLSNKIKVFGARVVLKIDEPEQQTMSGIIIPEKAQEKTYTGTVVAKGDGQRLSSGAHFPIELEIGDKVLYTRLAGVPIEIEGEEGQFLVINERDILAVFPSSP
ncbi:MAG: co-chaperone GroES [Ignavibacterium sp.]|nr:co-chaperone GroES [Ignavibacterium sp.]